MCKTTHTHYACFCTHLVVHSCALNYPLGRLVCPPPHLNKKDIYVYAACDDCVLATDEREERAVKASEKWMAADEEERETVDRMNMREEEVEVEEVVEIERAVGCEDEEGEIHDMERDLERDLKLVLEGYEKEDANEDEDEQLSAAQQAIQSEIEDLEGSESSINSDNDDLQAAAQLLSALSQEAGDSGLDAEKGDDDEYTEHINTIMRNLVRLREEKRSVQAKVDPIDIEQEEEA